jgi:hypothetical protein
MKFQRLSVLMLGLFSISSCAQEFITYILLPSAITVTADPGTIVKSQNLKLAATVDFGKGGVGSPEEFSVRFLNGTETLAESVISKDKTATKDILVTKSMNGTLTIKASVFRNNSTNVSSIVESQPVTVTVNIP